jgi:uncharacterized protein YegL
VFSITTDKKQKFEENSRKEILQNTISIFEQLKKKKIKVSFHKGFETSTKKFPGEYEIKIGTGRDAVSTKTKLERELAHVVFDSPDKEFIKKAKTIKTNTNRNQEMAFFKHLVTIYKTLEERRVESCYGQIYTGALERFIDARPDDARRYFDELQIPDDPIIALQLAKYDENKLVEKSDFQIAIEYIKAVELTGKKGAFDLAINYWERVVQPFLIQKLTQDNSKQDESKRTFTDFDELKDPDFYKNDKEYRTHIFDASNEFEAQQLEITFNSLKDIKVEAKKGPEKVMERISQPFQISPQSDLGYEEISEKHKETGKKEIAKIEEQIEKISKSQMIQEFGWEKLQKNIREEKFEPGPKVRYNKNTAKRLQNVFKRIQGGSIRDIDSVGTDIDVDSYIDYKINKIGNFLSSSKNYTGFDVVIAIDQSGSMKDNMDIVREMCATLYHAITDLPNIRLTVIGWSGLSELCIVKKITKPEHIGSLEANGNTPIGMAVWYSKNQIEKMRSKKRLFYLITDGEPNNKRDIHVAKEAIQIMKRQGVMCHGIHVGKSYKNLKEFMDIVFGRNYVVCRDFEEVDGLLTSRISKQIINSLKQSNYN